MTQDQATLASLFRELYSDFEHFSKEQRLQLYREMKVTIEKLENEEK